MKVYQVDKNSVFLSQGQFIKPSILFMDEATSSLDNTNEQYINDAIKSLNITRIVIAHRKSTINSADRIITLQENL